jgi:peptide/nickel transport system ATP-binding protein
MPEKPLLEIDRLAIGFDTPRGAIVPVRGVSMSIFPGQTMAVVGESGCGKSVTALSILGLVPRPPGRVLGGRILLEGQDLLGYSEKQMQRVRGRRIAMIFQEPMTSLNPVYTIGEQIAEAVALHQEVGRAKAYEVAEEALRDVGIADPHRRLFEYPHQMSGGMRQRVMIAMALSCRPQLLIADEPTTALDVTIQAQILELLQRLQRQRGMAILLITHDLGVVAEVRDGRTTVRASASSIHARPVAVGPAAGKRRRPAGDDRGDGPQSGEFPGRVRVSPPMPRHEGGSDLCDGRSHPPAGGTESLVGLPSRRWVCRGARIDPAHRASPHRADGLGHRRD